MIELIFLLVACALFGAAALGKGSHFGIDFLAAGLFFFALSFLWPHLAVALH